jgi:orotidine-5'-phosphate decarboxylase
VNETNVRHRLAVALDTSDLDEALAITRAVKPSIGIAKVGLQLFSAAGRDAVRTVQDTGLDVFLDVKLHDIPNTVHGASKVLGALGVRFLTAHASGGKEMLEAATILTSDRNASADALKERLDAAVAAGCGGVVCAASDLSVIRAAEPSIITVVPGIRPAGTPTHDQNRVSTPAEAIKKGADILVVGRAITGVNDRAAAAHAISVEVSQALSLG